MKKYEGHTKGPWKLCRSWEDFEGPYFDISDDREHYENKPFVSIQAEGEIITTAHDLFEFKNLANAELLRDAPLLLAQRDKLAEALRRFIALCPSPEGLGGHAPIGAFSIAADYAREALVSLEDS